MSTAQQAIPLRASNGLLKEDGYSGKSILNTLTILPVYHAHKGISKIDQNNTKISNFMTK